MNVDLLGTIRLLHRVLGFLAQQPAERLLEIADGRRHLLLSDPSSRPEPAVRSSTLVAEPVQKSAPGTRTDERIQPRSVAKAVGTAADHAEILAKLRSFADVDEGSAYLTSLRLDGRKLVKADLLGLCALADLEVATGTKVVDLQRRLLDHTIGAKKKYAGLARW